MAKKNKDDTPQAPTANSIVNRDIMQRLNFMYQASVYLSAVLPVPTPPPAPPKKRTKKSRKMTVHDLSKAYIHSMKVVSNKTMVKMDPGVKRTLCNGCNIVLVPGSTASVRVKSSRVHGHLMSYRCNSCNATRRIPAPPTLTETESAAGTSQIPVASTSEAAMDVDVDTDEPRNPKRNRKSKSGPIARLPPLFARDVGHVILCGNDTLPSRDAQRGDGIYIT
ncbi:RNAse P Rpr2/Rpp21/SNM1 subunit domain-containing protein [Mycena rosella]|uniref:RNAse P Rpr2/Rpp21/SNM1 subunit domain-containing protein n=1 Tax=Mycena rosella TaxID=1033263 RepID=A0AAD7DJQ4_MYCRO|nr:RNAse P Rpr2/Rpp21/SNM1 subunit domain-containing protein [Mycena rosella]